MMYIMTLCRPGTMLWCYEAHGDTWMQLLIAPKCDEIAGKECKQAVKNENTSLVTCFEKDDQPPLLALSIISHKLIQFGHKQS